MEDPLRACQSSALCCCRILGCQWGKATGFSWGHIEHGLSRQLRLSIALVTTSPTLETASVWQESKFCNQEIFSILYCSDFVWRLLGNVCWKKFCRIICLHFEIHKDGLFVFVTQSWSMQLVLWLNMYFAASEGTLSVVIFILINHILVWIILF